MLWSLQSETTYIASPAQSWIDDYFTWLTHSQCCSYDPDTLEVCQSNYGKNSPQTTVMTTPRTATTKEDNEFFDNDFFDGDSFDFEDGFDEEEKEKKNKNESAGDGKHLPDHMFSNYDEFYYYDEESETHQRNKRSVVSSGNCVPCSTRGQTTRPSPQQFRQHLKWFLEDNPGERCPVAGQAAYRDCVRLNEVKTQGELPEYVVNAR